MSVPHRTSYSGLEDFIRSPGLYYGRRIAKTIQRREDTDALRFGRAFDLALFEPDQYADQVAVGPRVDRGTRIGKAAQLLVDGGTVVTCQARKGTKAYAAAEANAPAGAMLVTPDEFDLIQELAQAIRAVEGKILISHDERNRIDHMVEAVQAHEIAAAMLLIPGVPQFKLEWTDERTGIVVRGKIDRLTDPVSLDGKTVGAAAGSSTPDLSPEGWGRKCVTYGYHRQEAIYRTGLQEMGLPQRSFAFLCCGSVEPFDVAVHELDEDAVDLGMRQFRQTLDRLAECLASDQWRAPHQSGVNSVSLPPWAFREVA